MYRQLLSVVILTETWYRYCDVAVYIDFLPIKANPE